MSENSDWKKLRKKLREQGLSVEVNGKSHWNVSRGGQLISVMPGSPGRGRAWRNQLAQLRRAGVNV